MEEASGAAEGAAAERGILCPEVESRSLFAVSLWDFPNMSLSYSLFYLARKLVLDSTVDAVEAGAKMTEHLAPSRFGCCCEFIDTHPRTNKRNHLAEARNCRIWKIRYIDR